MSKKSSRSYSKDPEEKLQQLKGFKVAVIAYFIVILIDSYCSQCIPLPAKAFAKVIPIFILLRFVVCQYASFEEMAKCKYCKSIFFGLCFSVVGDVLLVFEDISNVFFIFGLISFACGHVMYIRAFGWRPFGTQCFFIFLFVAVGFYRYLWFGGLKVQPGVMQAGVAVYAMILATMNWRSWARLSLRDFIFGRWYEFLGCLGALSFLVSDSALSIDKFLGEFAYSEYIIMGTYYIGQLGIALSVVDGPDRYIHDGKRD